MKKISTPVVSESSVDFLAEYFENTRSGAAYLIESFVPLMKRTLHELKGKFTWGELSLIIDVFVSTSLTPALSGQHLYLSCADAIDLDGADKKWGIDKKIFLDKISAITMYQSACLELWAHGFWNNATHANDDQRFEDYVKSLL